jgi:leucyl-tRNA synthetase
VPVPESDLPVLLPENVTDFLPKGRSPLADVPEFMEVACPKCEGDARRDADTMDTFMCSAWYHLRYADARNDRVIFDREKADAWLPIDIYIGGAEHATGHLIYFRFMTKVLRDAGYLSCDEPALVLINHGMVQDAGGRKMSKRTGNLVSPQELMKKVGIDAARIAMFFFAPSTDPILWNDEAVHGARRFLDRVWDTATSLAPRIQGVESASGPAGLSKSGKEIRRRTHEAIRRVTDGLAGDLKFNTGIAALMELVNALRSGEGGEIPEADVAAHAEAIRAMTKLFAPLAPHLAEELYHLLGGEGTVFRAGWPEVDPSAAVRDEVEIAVQVNGKVRGRLNVAADIAEAEVLRLAREDGSVARHLEGKEIVKQIYVPGRLVSLNVKE